LLTARPGLDARSLTVIVYGWAALPPATLASMKRHCGDDLCVFEIFGQTESISCYRFWPDEWPELYAATAPQHNYVGVPSQILGLHGARRGGSRPGGAARRAGRGCCTGPRP